jgi:hypothetical protein
VKFLVGEAKRMARRHRKSINLLKARKRCRNRHKREHLKQPIEADFEIGTQLVLQHLPSPDCTSIVIDMLRELPPLPYIDELLEITRFPFCKPDLIAPF